MLVNKNIAGYTNQISAVPGDTLEFRISVYDDAPSYDAKLVRLMCTDSHKDGPGLVESPIEAPFNGEHEARHQPIHAGSYLLFDSIPAFESVTLLAFIWPTRIGHAAQAIMARQADAAIWFGVAADGALCLRVNDKQFSTGTALREREWLLATASYNSASGEVRVTQQPLEVRSLPSTFAQTSGSTQAGLKFVSTPFTIAAAGNQPGSMRDHFNGKIDRPRLSAVACDLTDTKELSVYEPSGSASAALIGAWDLWRELESDRIIDVSGHARHGRAVNLPARAMTGHNWRGEEHDWRHAPQEYGAIHFHDDDIYDVGWTTDFSFVVPEDLDSGTYAAKLTAGGPAEHVVFWVRPPRGKSNAQVCFLASTASYMAYGNYRVMDIAPVYEAFQGRLLMTTPEDLFLSANPALGGSLYQSHSDGSGVCYSSRLRPLVSMRPNTTLYQFAADGYLTYWLHQQGFSVDTVTDEDLDKEGYSLIENHRVVITGNHPEYWSTRMWDAMQEFLDAGGRLMYLGGNGFYWRIAYSDVFPGVIEVRRAEDGTRPWVSAPGEYRLSFTGEMSGLWRRNNRTPNRLVGVGMTAQGFDRGTYYRRNPDSFDARAAFIFDGIGDDEIIGDFGFALDGASGQEIDRYDASLGSPTHALVVATSEGHGDNMLLVNEEYQSSHLMLGGTENPAVRSDMVFFETAAGGAVFSTGSISWISSLACNDCDNNVSTITGNVLRRFAHGTPFHFPNGA